MTGPRAVDDRISTPPAIPGGVLHALLPVTAAIAAVCIVPILGWQIAIVAFAVLGMLFPHTMGGWLSIACIAIGMLLAEPDIGRTMIAVLLVHILHVLSSLLPIVPWRGGAVLAALRPTLVRLVLIEAVAQPVALVVMLVHGAGVTAVGGAVLVGAAAVAGLAILFLLRAKGRSRGS